MSKADGPGLDVEMSSAKFLKDDEKEKPAAVAIAAQSPKGFRKQAIDVACIGLNIISTVTLVFLNKWYVCKNNRRIASLT
jgi:hypothetical protein